MPGPVGIAANVADALVYGIVDHDAVGVTLSLLGALTMGAGSVAKLAGAGAKVTKTAKAIQYGSMFITSGLQFALNAKNTINVGKTMYDKYIVNGQKTDKNTYAEVAALVLNSAGMFISGTQIYSSGRGFVNELSTSVNSNVLTEVNAGGREVAAEQCGVNKAGSKSKWWHEGYVDNLSDTQVILGVKQSDKGLSTLGSSSRQTAMSAGKAWVGENYSTITDNLGDVIGYSSSDGIRAFRIQYKNKEGIWRANFQENIMANNPYPNIGQHRTELKNVHIDIFD